MTFNHLFKMMIGKLTSYYADFRRVQKRDGLISALRSSLKFIRRYPETLLFADNRYQSTRVDNEERFAMMSSRMKTSASNALDIGCNEGYITRQVAQEGMFTIGIDRKKAIIKQARRKTDSVNCHFIQQDLTPDTIKQLPLFDVTFLLDVYYHWGNAYGWPEAERMLSDLADSSNQLFIETPKSLDFINSDRLDSKRQIDDGLEAYFSDVVPNKTVDLVGETSYRGKERTELIFEISGED